MTGENPKYLKKMEYLSDPSIDLINRFKEDIVCYECPSSHSEYVPCNHGEKSKGYMLFVLRGRVEVLIKPDLETRELLFMDCDDV